MNKVSIPITERARKYGYIFWPAALDEKMQEFFQDVSTVNLVFQGAEHGEKNVDWAHRRISIGWRWTRNLPHDVSDFVLTWKDKKTVSVLCR
jgi:hypothetical protein